MTIRHFDESVGRYRVRVIADTADATVSILVTRAGHVYGVHVLDIDRTEYAIGLAQDQVEGFRNAR